MNLRSVTKLFVLLVGFGITCLLGHSSQNTLPFPREYLNIRDENNDALSLSGWRNLFLVCILYSINN